MARLSRKSRRDREPNRKRKYGKIGDIEAANRRNFHEAAWKQRVCAMCGQGGPFQSHHVVEKQRLRIIGRLDLKWDVRNALRVCHDCHGKQHRGKRIALRRLTDENYEFAWFVLGTASADYLRDRYEGDDPRWDALMEQCNAELEQQRRAAVG